ncbi:uncharacterized protein LOC127838782 isoform X1 [Dreissena polymorpha]|uniref:Metalloendopeptidase n=1 Tax=Dreissena polymorpha TaxID=45954 RepID=A0A9D4J612_DREPO|nr:uncharacterized protein LOC127838782 isoform X1 [Dreissena polymorpha]KAH3796582.1 hypothetical protein DPMN_150151 [Dreissena polymorpha]
MWKAAQLMVFALVLGQGQSAIDDVFRQVQEEYDDKTKDVASGRSSAHLQSDWCRRYSMNGSNRTLVKLHYDMVIDVETYEDVVGKKYSFENEGSCQTHSVVGQAENRRRRAATKSEESRWPLEIPYQIDEGFVANVNLTIMKAMENWSRYTCLHFVERTQQYDRIIFSPAEGCESYVGRIKGPQYISLDPQNCVTLPIILHEIGHAIGLYHEHTRADRDNNVTVNFEYIKEEFHFNFDKFNATQYLDFNKPYDYRSIMHYGKNFFANPRNATSLEPSDKHYLNIIGEAELLSFHDVQIVNAMYKCKEKCAHVECPKGAFVGKNCECFCQGPPEDPVQRCKHPKNMALLFCEPPAIDLATYFVYSIGKVELVDLSGTQYPDGTVLIVENPRCSKHGNYTCQDGKWVDNINCKPDRCVYNTSRYDFKPNITADGQSGTTDYVNNGTHVHVKCRAPKRTQGYDSECRDSIWVPELPNCDADRCVYDMARYVFKPNITSDGFSGTTEYVNSGTFVHVECIAPKGIPRYDSKCTDSLWDPALPNCDAAVDCTLENFDARNVEVLFKGKVKTDGDVIPDGSSVVARCKGTNKPNILRQESQSTMICKKGQLEGQIPTPCPTVLYACPIVQYANTSGPLNNDYDVKCFNRYEMQPRLQARFHCDWRGVWQPFVPRCIPESCQVVYDSAKAEIKLMDGSGKPPNLTISSGQTISIACTQPGHVPDQMTLTCDRGVYNETSNKTLPLCKLVTCKPPPLSGDVVYTSMNSYRFKDTVVIQRCKGKLWFQGDQRLTCTADGTWNGTATCTPYCQHGTEKWEEKQNSDLIKHTIRNITVESYKECLNYCNNYDRILCRAFAYGFDQGKRRCHITYADPSRYTEMLGERKLWSVWFRKCD